MAGFCLMPMAVDKFKAGLQSGKIDPAKLSEMTSEERNKFFEDYVGKPNAKDVNALFESKLLLKNQQQGFITWAKTVAGLKPSVQRDLISRIQRMDKVLDPADKQQFMKDLAAQKLGFGVTQEEAKTLSDMGKSLAESKAAADKAVADHGYTKASQDARLKAGADRVAMEKYVSDKKALANKRSLGENLKPQNYIRDAKAIMGSAKGLVASMTSHAPLKHGFFALFEDPKNWAHNYVTQFSDAAKSIGGKDVMSAIRAEGYSRENAMNGIYDKWIPGELSKTNEEYHSDVPSKVPVLGRLYQGSKTMFDGFNLKMRLDLVDHYVNIVKKMGLDPKDPEVAKAWGKLAIDQTGGKTTNPDNALGFFLFSQRLLKSQVNNLTLHLFDKTATTATRVQSAKTLAKVVTGLAAVITTANALRPGTVELDPRSANFGKAKVGDTRFDIAGGYGSIITLAARIASAIQGKPAIKSSSTGMLSNVGTGIGQTSYATLIGDFLTGRGSPAEQIISDLANQQTFSGGKPTIGSEVKSLVTPIPVQTYSQLRNDPNSANMLAVMIAQQLGLMSNTYGAAGLNESSKKVSQFKSSVGDTKFKQANSDYTNQLSQWELALQRNKQFQAMPKAQQQKIITAKKNALQSAVFSKYQ